MSVEYKGDTHGKRLARADFWISCKKLMGDSFFTSKICYLASAIGGDTSVLLALGVPAKNQIAIDMDSGALKSFSQKFPEIETYLGDATQFFQSWKGPLLGVIFMDFFNGTSPRDIQTMLHAATKMQDKGILAYALQRGREGSCRTKAIAEDRKLLLNNQEQFCRSNNLDPARQFVQIGGDGVVIPAPPDVMKRATDARSLALYDRLWRSGEFTRTIYSTASKIFYQSKTRDSPGTPMLIVAYMVAKYPNMNRTRFKSHRHTVIENTFKAGYVAHDIAVKLKLGQDVSLMYIDSGPAEIIQAIHVKLNFMMSRDFTKCNAFDIVQSANSLESIYGERVSDIFNISKGTLAALRAHAKRGTYE